MNERITINPAQMGGVPCIRGLRIPVETIAGLVSEGASVDSILRDYPDLTREDVRAAVEFDPKEVRK